MPVGFVSVTAEASDEANTDNITSAALSVVGGSDSVILIKVTARTATAPATLTFDGGSNLIGSADEVVAWFANGNAGMGWWRVLNEAAGSKTATVTWAANTRPKAIHLIESDGADSTDATNTATGASTAPAVTLTTNTDASMAVGGIGQDGNNNAPPIQDWTGGSEAGETERLDEGSGSGPNSIHFSIADIIKATAGAQDLSATSDSDGQWVIAGVEITEEAVAAAKPITATLTVPRYPNEHRQHQVFA